jgi:hypothetical protein
MSPHTLSLSLPLAAALQGGCAGGLRELTPAPVLLAGSGAATFYQQVRPVRRATSVDLLSITNRAQAPNAADGAPYREARAPPAGVRFRSGELSAGDGLAGPPPPQSDRAARPEGVFPAIPHSDRVTHGHPGQ